MKGYKCFKPNMTCREFKYEVGKSYTHKGEIKLCKAGFHFCKNPADVFNYYNFEPDNVVCEIEASGNIEHGKDKSVCSKIKIVKRLTWEVVLTLVNSGTGNTGKYNAGNRNSGNWNSGNWNSGNWNSGNRNSGNSNSGKDNTGDWNSGDWNSGDYNTGFRNSGDWNTGYCNSGNCNSGYYNSGFRNSGPYNSGNHNSGDWNSGDYNTGFRNSGDWNSCDNESGFFNSTNSDTVRVFNKECSMEKWENAEKPEFFYFKITEWIEDTSGTNVEYLRTYDYKDAWKKSWENAKQKDNWEEEYNKLINLPNFDPDIFEEITGINIKED